MLKAKALIYLTPAIMVLTMVASPVLAAPTAVTVSSLGATLAAASLPGPVPVVAALAILGGALVGRRRR